MRRSRATISASMSVALVLAPQFAVAQGCGPTRLKVTESVALDVAPAKLWAMIGNFQDMSWDSDAVATRGAGNNTPDKASRVVTLKGGAEFGESLYKYDSDAMSYAYHIDKVDVGRLPIQNASMTLEIVPADGGKSLLRWKGAFYRYLAPGEGTPDVADANAAKAVRAYLRSALDGLKAKAEAKT